jgi:hypothetical protein
LSIVERTVGGRLHDFGRFSDGPAIQDAVLLEEIDGHGLALEVEVVKDLVPPMVKAGDGYNIHVTGLTHDERGYPVMTVAAQEKLVRRLVDKIRKNADAIVEYREVIAIFLAWPAGRPAVVPGISEIRRGPGPDR